MQMLPSAALADLHYTAFSLSVVHDPTPGAKWSSVKEEIEYSARSVIHLVDRYFSRFSSKVNQILEKNQTSTPSSLFMVRTVTVKIPKGPLGPREWTNRDKWKSCCPFPDAKIWLIGVNKLTCIQLHNELEGPFFYLIVSAVIRLITPTITGREFVIQNIQYDSLL